MTGEYDLVIIGTGAAGVAAATTAVHLGASRVAMVERGPLWGTCVNTGCIPSKFLLTLAGYDYYRGHGHAGIRMESRLDLGQVLAEKNALQEHLKEKSVRPFLTGSVSSLSRGRQGSSLPIPCRPMTGNSHQNGSSLQRAHLLQSHP